MLFNCFLGMETTYDGFKSQIIAQHTVSSMQPFPCFDVIHHGEFVQFSYIQNTKNRPVLEYIFPNNDWEIIL